MKTLLQILIIGLGSWLSSPVHAAAEKNAIETQLPAAKIRYTLERLSAESESATTFISLKFDKKHDAKDIKIADHGTFIQIDLQDTIVPNPGEFIDGAGPYLDKMAAFQLTSNTAGIRLFLKEDASLVKKALNHDILGKHLALNINHKILSELIKKDPANSAAMASGISAEKVIAQTTVQKNIEKPATSLQNIPVEKTPTVNLTDGNLLQEQMLKVTGFCAILLLGMFAIYAIRPRMRRARAKKAGIEEAPTMTTLATHVLAPKQKLQLIDIQGQRILLGISPDNISFLTEIEDPATKIQRTRQQLKQKQAPAAATPVVKTAAARMTPQPKKLQAPKRATQGAQKVPESKNSALRQLKHEKSAPVSVNLSGNRPAESDQAISDVTRLIREKLKNLPAI